jgi:Fe-S-cluster containining protein
MNIDLTPIEARYISENAHYPVNLANLYRLSDEGDHQACPFLDSKGCCKVYKYRPFSCRCHFAFTEPSICDITKDLPAKTVNFTCNEVMLELSMIIAKMNGDEFLPYYSIHSYFPFKVQ